MISRRKSRASAPPWYYAWSKLPECSRGSHAKPVSVPRSRERNNISWDYWLWQWVPSPSYDEPPRDCEAWGPLTSAERVASELSRETRRDVSSNVRLIAVHRLVGEYKREHDNPKWISLVNEPHVTRLIASLNHRLCYASSGGYKTRFTWKITCALRFHLELQFGTWLWTSFDSSRIYPLEAWRNGARATHAGSWRRDPTQPMLITGIGMLIDVIVNWDIFRSIRSWSIYIAIWFVKFWKCSVSLVHFLMHRYCIAGRRRMPVHGRKRSWKSCL